MAKSYYPDLPANFGKSVDGNWPGKKFGAASSTTSRRLGQPGIGVRGFSVYVDVRELIHAIDTIEQRFRPASFYNALRRANEEAADKIKRGMVEELERQMESKRPPHRPQRPGERLKNSLLHERNHEITPLGFTVGRWSWLEQSPAQKYFRAIEYGMPAEYGLPLLFTNNFKKFVGPWSPDGGYKKTPPKGYPHMRMVTAGNIVVQKVGPWPAYRYSKGGLRTARAMDWRDLYERHLSDAGLPTAGVFKTRARSPIRR